MPTRQRPRHWFSAKRYGWGWGPPCAWQGWVVLILFVALVLGGIPMIHGEVGVVGYLFYVALLSALLMLVCRLTGPPPRWHWGKDDS